MTNDKDATNNEATKDPGTSPASPGDNRGAGDLDGNRSSKGGKAPGPNEPQAPSKQG
jgi:hypothetical protein